MYRARAHSNPLNESLFEVPASPDKVDWSSHFPDEVQGGQPLEVKFADVGCGFGGLLFRLSPLFPDKLMVGIELRDKVSEYVKQKILTMRGDNPGKYTNISVIRTNAMKYLPNYFHKGQLEKMFFLFPDPHFKAANHRRRIINTTLITEYAFVLSPGGMLYTITDVPELGTWMREKLRSHPMFDEVPEDDLKDDVACGLLTEASEEAQKVARNEGQTFLAVFRRRESAR